MFAQENRESIRRKFFRPVNALVHAIEINDRHGVGVYIRRMFGDGRDFVFLRSRSLYEGTNEFGTEEFLGDRFSTLSELRARIAGIVSRHPIERILCVPYYPEDFRNAVLLKEASGAKLCTYLMDDQNIFAREVGDAAVRRLLDASELRLGISPQMSLAYERKFGREVAWMPPVLPARRTPDVGPRHARRAALIGNVWSAMQLGNLRQVARESGWAIDWFGRGPEAGWLDATPEALASDNVHCLGYLEDAALAGRLAEYPFAIIPSGTADDADDIRSFSLLSLPSRVIHLLTQAALPLLVMGGERSAVAAFVQETGCGLVAPYNATAFSSEAERLVADESGFRAAASGIAERMTLADAGDWIWSSLDRGAPVDDRFESMRTGRLAVLECDVLSERIFPAPQRRGWFARRFGGLGPLEGLRFSRGSQLRAIRRHAPLDVTGPHSFEVSTYQRALATALVRERVKAGDRVGVLDGDPGLLRPLHTTHRVENATKSDRGFDAIVSFHREGPATFEELNAMVVAGGLHVHCWTAYLHPGHFSAPPEAMKLLDAIDDCSLVSDAILDAEDLLFMSPRATERFWKISNPEVGRPFSLNLCWEAGR